MRTSRIPGNQGVGESVNRRNLVKASAVLPAAAIIAGSPTLLSAATPSSSPVAVGVGLPALLQLSTRLTGMEGLDEEMARGLMDLLSQEPDIEDALAELTEMQDVTPEALTSVSPESRRIATNILQFWYLGQYDGEPVANRAEMFFQLAAWRALPYTTMATLCKSFGYWAVDVEAEL